MRKQPEATRIILVRHLDTKARQTREAIKSDNNNKVLLSLFDKPNLTSAELEEMKRLGNMLFGRYGRQVDDPVLEILPSQYSVGNRLGKAVVEQYGVPGRWETSVFTRGRQSSKAMRDGIVEEGIDLSPEIKNKRLAERNFGDASEWPSTKAYLAAHTEEFIKHRKNPDGYTFKHGESRRGFRRRVGRQVWLEKWARRYEGKTTVMVTHSMVIEEQLQRLIGHTKGNDDIWTGTVTVLEADKRKHFWQPRRYHLVGQVGQQLV